MRPSPLQLTDYFLSEVHLTANAQFDAEKEVTANDDSFQCGVELLGNKEDKRKWQVILKLQHQPPAEANVPYRFAVAIVGFFIVHPRYPDETVERLVRTNGPSMLYGMLREVVRDLTARGPYAPPVLLPSASFYEPEPKKPEPVAAAAPQK